MSGADDWSFEADGVAAGGGRRSLSVSVSSVRMRVFEIFKRLSEMAGAFGMHAHELLKFGRPPHMKTLQVADAISGRGGKGHGAAHCKEHACLDESSRWFGVGSAGESVDDPVGDKRHQAEANDGLEVANHDRSLVLRPSPL